MNLKIFFVIAICFSIGFTSLYFVNDWYRVNFDVEKWRLNWYSELKETERKGFLLGDSRIYVLDELHISEKLFQNGENVTIYDLAIGQKNTNYWLDHLSKIILSKPEIIIIGIDPANFDSKKSKEPPAGIHGPFMDNSFLRNSDRFIHDIQISLNLNNLDINNFKNPKFTTLKIIKFIETGIPDNNFKQIPTQPFFSEGKQFFRIEDSKQLSSMGPKFNFNIIENGEQELALIEIIQILKKNNVNTILIIPPRPQAFLERWEGDSQDNWNELLIRLEQRTEIKIFNFQSQFSDKNIFADYDHVTRLPEGKIFSEEIAKIINLELNS